MNDLKYFVAIVENEFPQDRLTWQKGIATFHPESADETSRLFQLSIQHKQKLFI